MIFTLLALLLPISVAAWMFWWPDLTRPWLMGMVILLVTSLVVWVVSRKWKKNPALEDRSLSLFLAGVYLILPMGAFLLGLNQAFPSHPRVTRQEVMDRYPETVDGSHNAWIFLWTGEGIHKIKVTPSDPLYLCRPLDSVALVYVTGSLGFEYLDHVDRLQ